MTKLWQFPLCVPAITKGFIQNPAVAGFDANALFYHCAMKETNAFMACKSQKVPETLFEVSKSVSKVSESVSEASKSVSGASESVSEASKRVSEVSSGVFEASKSVSEASSSVFEASKIVARASKRASEAFCCFFNQTARFANSIFTIPSIDYLNFFFIKIQFYG